MTDNLSPNGRPGLGFDGEFGGEPPLIDMVPRAMAAYRRGRRRRQLAGAGGGLAALTAAVLVMTRLPGGAAGGGTGGGPNSAQPGAQPTRATWTPTPITAPSGSKPVAATPTTGASDACDKNFTLQEKAYSTPSVPIPDQAAARSLCELGTTAMKTLIPGHAWAPATDGFVRDGSAYLADDYSPSGDAQNLVTTAILTRSEPRADCGAIGYPQTKCDNVTLADGTRGIVLSSTGNTAPKPFAYSLWIDRPNGTQVQFTVANVNGGTPVVTLSQYLGVIKSADFTAYLKQYEAVIGSR